MIMNGQQIVRKPDFRQILGVRFFVGKASQAVDLLRGGGLLVVPGAPALKNLPEDHAYREALMEADLAIADSSLMVMVWNLVQRDNIQRLSGLEYLAELLKQPAVKKPGGCFWIMASRQSAEKNLVWLRQRDIEVHPEDIYIAPIYGLAIRDEVLLERIRERKPKHVIVTIGGGTQEKLGLYLKRNLETLPAIHCVGAAIAFLSGDQVQIPMWADRFYFGWIFRCISQPKRFVPRYWSARKLVGLLIRYRTRIPLATAKEA
jgi:N-acetylglucosaminyldiphosphoundecaprenol N-acetyl-beta-D-mannosaminyltransferase